MPFIAMWKKLPSCRIGMKKSAESKMISRQPASETRLPAYCVTAMIMPSAAPP